MAFVVLGEVCDLDEDEVTRSTIEAFKTELQKRPKTYPIDCRLCGQDVPVTVTDPGVLQYQRYECSDLVAVCRTPAIPRTMRVLYTFIPGCFVFAPVDPVTKTRWPGIIESCPVGAEGHLIEGKKPGTIKAYFVTFIYPEVPGRKWVGGFIEAKQVKPFEQMKHLPFEGSDRAEYERSVQLTNDSILLSLRLRLLKFSFVAYVASKRHIPLGQGESSTTNFWQAFHAKRPAVEPFPGSEASKSEEAPKKLPRLEPTGDWKEPDDSASS